MYTELAHGVLTIILDRPKANAFNRAMIDATAQAFKRAARDDQIRCVLLTGRGRFFSGGQDVSEFSGDTQRSFRKHLQQTYNPLILQIRRLEKPVLAAINGAIAGASLGVALACDLRIAADTATFVVGFLGIGLVPDSAVSLLLPTLVGLGRAAELAFGNHPLNAEQALAWGLVNRLASPGELEIAATSWAQELAQGPVSAMGLTKRAFNNAILHQLEAVLDYESHLQEIAGQGFDHREGLLAFQEKRPPKYV